MFLCIHLIIHFHYDNERISNQPISCLIALSLFLIRFSSIFSALLMNRLSSSDGANERLTINLKVSRVLAIQNQYTYQMLIFPVNICTARTGRKLQGRLKDIIIISSWPKLQGKAAFINWEYVVLS